MFSAFIQFSVSFLCASILSSRATELHPPWAQQNRYLSLTKPTDQLASWKGFTTLCIRSWLFPAARSVTSRHTSPSFKARFCCSLACPQQKILSLLNPCLRYLSSLQPNLKQSFHPYCTTSFSSPGPVPYLYSVVFDDQLAPWELFHHWNRFLI